MIQHILPSDLIQISKIKPNLENEITNNLGITSYEMDKPKDSKSLSMLSRNKIISAFALYNTNPQYINIFRLYGQNEGIKEIVNWFKNNKNHLFIQIPFSEIKTLNLLKSMKIFSFDTYEDVVIATYPEEEAYYKSFKNFINQD